MIFATLFLSVTLSAQKIDWDLSYASLLERNRINKNEWIQNWLATTRSPAADWITGWKGKPIVSSILIEHPAFHAAERTTEWLIRTHDEAFYWVEVEGTTYGRNEEPIDPKIYDDIYKQVASWQQFAPRSADTMPEDTLTGYIGFLSLAGSNTSRQMLLTLDDFMVCLNKTCMPGKGLKSGRLMAAFEPIYIPDAQKNYRHKSESEIARMTPDERIDEEIKERDHLTDSADNQHQLIRKYRVLDGVKGSRRIIELMDSYEPRRLRDRSFDAVILATDIDENSIRLRASAEGRLIIEAIERLAARMPALAREDSHLATTLAYIKGVNFTDEAIRDTLRMRYRINLTDAEILEFSNYLVKHHPTYPRWSTRYMARDNSNKNEAGFPAQVLVMKSPDGYRQAYEEFKRSHRTRATEK